MFRISSRWLVVPAAAVGVCAILFAEPRDGRRNDTWTAIERIPAASDPAERDRDRESAKLCEIYALRIDCKEKLIEQLIDGRATLDAVADEFLRLNQDIPTTLRMIRMQYPGVADDEAAALNVIEYVEQRLERGAQRIAVHARLGAEFRKHYGHDYKILD